MRKCFYYCTWQMCQLLCGYAELQLHPNQNIYGSSSCPRCNLLRFNGTTLWLCKTFWKETHITQEPHNEQGFFMFYHTAFKIWVHQEGKMQIAFGFLFKKKKKKKKEIQKGGEGRREAPLKQLKYIHASPWLEFLVCCYRAAAQSCPRYLYHLRPWLGLAWMAYR